MRLQDHYPMRDKSLCIGTLAECFNNMPSVLNAAFNEFYPKVIHLMKTEENEELIRNCAFALGTCAQLQPTLMKSKVNESLEILQAWIGKVTDEGAKDNIISAMYKIVTFNFDPAIYQSLAETLYTNIPLKEDLDENEHISK
mmetsp:Transcript_26545/g.23459  ORF Transcript_26545/g.23459 Transcript_26545/m.23459 type:complete len:142 (-) Transcript_26545:284-709(-)